MSHTQWVIFLDRKPISKAIDSIGEAQKLALESELRTNHLRIEGFRVESGEPTLVGAYEYDEEVAGWVKVQ